MVVLKHVQKELLEEFKVIIRLFLYILPEGRGNITTATADFTSAANSLHYPSLHNFFARAVVVGSTFNTLEAIFAKPSQSHTVRFHETQ